MKKAIFLGLIVLIVFIFANDAFAMLPFPYDIAPYKSDAQGNAARRLYGGYFKDGLGEENVIYWLGTDSVPPGQLILDFSSPFGDVAGNDFAVLTGNECWGPQAGDTLFEFYMGSTLVGSLNAFLVGNSMQEFELPGSDIVGNRIVIINAAQDPPGINNDACMEFRDAGVARYDSQAVPEPSTMMLFGISILGAGFIRKTRATNKEGR